MARGSIIKRQSGNYAIVYYVDGKQRWETIGPSRRDAERALTARKREVDTGTWREPSSETLASYAERWLAHRDPARVQAGRTRLAPSTFAEYRRALAHPRLTSPRRTNACFAPDGGRRRLHRRARGRRQGAGHGAQHRRAVTQDARRCGSAGEAPRQPGRAGRPSSRAGLRRQGDPARAHERDPGGARRPGADRSTPKRTGSLFRLFLRRRAWHRPSARRASRPPLGRRRSRPARDSRRTRLLPARAQTSEDRCRSSLGAALRVRGRGTSRARCASRRARAVRAGRADLRDDSGNPAARVELQSPRLAPGARAGGARRGGYRFHDLRHTCVSRLVAAGADVKLVQAVAGHSNPLITLKRYSHLLDARISEAADRFDPARVP